MHSARTITCGLALVMTLAGAYELGAQETSTPQEKTAENKDHGLMLSGDIALWTIAIKPDKTADFEKVLARVRDALQQSDDPQRKRQAAGWRVMRIEKPLADGNIAYVHVITPVVGADYSLLKPIYDAFPSEGQQLYETYRGAFAQNLALASGSLVIDMSKPQP